MTEERKTVVGALIKKNDKILVFQRPLHKLNGGLWEFVGGKVEKGETPQEALIRECKEEIDVLVKPEKLIYSFDFDYPEIKIHLMIFESEIISGQINLKEHINCKWIPISDLNNYSFCPADIPIIKDMQKNLDPV